MQALEFGPAHLHRDIVGADGGICNEIQFDPISLQNRSAAYRSIDEAPSHIGIRRALSSAVREPGLHDVTAHDGLESRVSRITQAQASRLRTRHRITS